MRPCCWLSRRAALPCRGVQWGSAWSCEDLRTGWAAAPAARCSHSQMLWRDKSTWRQLKLSRNLRLPAGNLYLQRTAPLCTWNVVKGRQRFSAEVDGNRPLPHLFNHNLPLLLLQQLQKEFMRRHHKDQRQLLQAFTQSPAQHAEGHYISWADQVLEQIDSVLVIWSYSSGVFL